MSIKIPKPLLFLISFCVALALYWPAMNGTPVWDDYTFWFTDPVMKSTTTYTDIWLRFAWPLSVSVQKVLLSIFQKNYFSYHLINFVLHFTNSLFVYWIARLLRFKHSFIIFLLFLLHPACVISTAWMVQIKTLLCLFFALGSVLSFMKGQKDIRWMIVSWALFALSILSKSASITLPVLFLVYSFKQYRFKKLALLVPFFLFSLASTYRVLNSEITKEGTEKAVKIAKVHSEEEKKIEAPVEEKPAAVPEVPRSIEPPVKPKEEKKKKRKTEVPKPVVKEEKKPEPVIVPELKPEPPPVVPLPEKTVVINNTDIKKDSWLSLVFIKVNGTLILQTLNYYFWQVLLPLDSTPVKGLNYDKAGFIEYLHLFFLVSMVIIFIKESALYYLVFAHFLLIPFLGIMPAPYMTVTWVSDQHLYLVLPALIFFWMRIVEKIKWRYAVVIPLVITAFFCFKTYEASTYYRSEIAFYEKCVDQNPFNIPIVYNLAFAYLLQNNLEKASTLLENTIILSQSRPVVQKNLYFPHLVSLYQEIQGMIYAN